MANSDASSQCEKEIACCLSWFTNFRTHEKEEFLKILLDKAVPSNVDTLFDAMNHVTVSDKPPTIFQCQLKLFNQWYAGWPPFYRQQFFSDLTGRDAEFMARLNECVFQHSTKLS